MERLTIKGDRPFGVNAGPKVAPGFATTAAVTQGEDRIGRHRPGLARPVETLIAKSQ